MVAGSVAAVVPAAAVVVEAVGGGAEVVVVEVAVGGAVAASEVLLLPPRLGWSVFREFERTLPTSDHARDEQAPRTPAPHRQSVAPRARSRGMVEAWFGEGCARVWGCCAASGPQDAS